MYARELMTWLHRRLSQRDAWEQTQTRFEQMRGYNLLPRGRERAGQRLTDEEIANAVFGYADARPGYAGHTALLFGGLRPVGGPEASFEGARDLQKAVAFLVHDELAWHRLVRLNLSIERDFADDRYKASLIIREGATRRTIAFVSKYDSRIERTGAEVEYDHDRLDCMKADELALGPSFFRKLARDASVSRQLDRPLTTDWKEYTTEEEKADFHRRLGARPSSHFLNLRVDAQVAWPNEPTRIEFGGHHLVLFPKTKAHSHSVSVDLANERITAEDARSLINRMLSVMSWCEDQPSSVHEGWSGNPVPIHVSRRDLAFSTMMQWHFYREDPSDEHLRRCLAYYRDGLNAVSVGLASHAVLSFFRVFETTHHTTSKAKTYIRETYPAILMMVGDTGRSAFETDLRESGKAVEDYLWVDCRIATAHAAQRRPSDPDGTGETRRLLDAAKVMRAFARHFVVTEFSYAETYLAE